MPLLHTSIYGKYVDFLNAVATFFVVRVCVHARDYIRLQTVARDTKGISESGKLCGYSQQLSKPELTPAHETGPREP